MKCGLRFVLFVAQASSQDGTASEKSDALDEEVFALLFLQQLFNPQKPLLLSMTKHAYYICLFFITVFIL